MTEYEKSLSKRTAKVGDKFILRGDVYEAVGAIKGTACTGCALSVSSLCECGSPDCYPDNVIFVKEIV